MRTAEIPLAAQVRDIPARSSHLVDTADAVIARDAAAPRSDLSDYLHGQIASTAQVHDA